MSTDDLFYQNLSVDNQLWLSGYFSTSSSLVKDFLKNVDKGSLGWSRVVISDDVVMDMNNFYYPEVVDFHVNKKLHVVLNIDQYVWVGDKQVHVDKIRLSLMPFNILIYSIGLHVEHVELSQMFSILNQLRQINSYDRNESVGEFVNVAIQPVRELYALLSGNKYERNSQLVENGNKLKIFQVVTTSHVLHQLPNANNLLYSLGTLSMNDPDDYMSSSEEYIESVLRTNKVSVFNNWSALSLLDTMTFLTDSGIRDYVRTNWLTDYFELIYLYQLYRKIFLYRTNNAFRLKRMPTKKLQQDIDVFNNHYSFSYISYNFLPNILNNTIELTFEISEELEQINQVVNRVLQLETEHREKQSNTFLTFLAVIASFSAIWDTNCLIDAIFNYESCFDVAIVGYRLITSVLLTIVFIVAIISKRKK